MKIYNKTPTSIHASNKTLAIGALCWDNLIFHFFGFGGPGGAFKFR